MTHMMIESYKNAFLSIIAESIQPRIQSQDSTSLLMFLLNFNLCSIKKRKDQVVAELFKVDHIAYSYHAASVFFQFFCAC
jgi:hypothetical protein